MIQRSPSLDARKPKPKRRSSAFPIAVGFDFVAPLRIGGCRSRIGALQDLRTKNDDWAPVALVRFDWVDDNTLTFTLQEKAPAPVLVVGELHRLDDATTYVTGVAQVRLRRHGLEVGALLALVVVLAWLVGAVEAGFFLPLALGYAVFVWRGACKERDRLLAMLRDALY